MMVMDYDLQEEYRQRLIDRYTASELVEILDISIEDILDNYEPRWSGNAFLLTEVGMLDDEEQDQ